MNFARNAAQNVSSMGGCALFGVIYTGLVTFGDALPEAKIRPVSVPTIRSYTLLL